MSQQINLFNPIFLKQKKYFSAIAMLEALGMILVGSILFYAYAQYHVVQLRQQSAETDRRYHEEQAKLARNLAGFSPRLASQLLEEELKKVEIQLAVQQELVKTLDKIGNTTGYSEYLRAFARQVVPGLWLTDFSILGDASQMSLSGGALNPAQVPIYIRHLNREEIMHGKSFSALQMRLPKAETDKPREGHYVEFVLQSAAGDTEK